MGETESPTTTAGQDGGSVMRRTPLPLCLHAAGLLLLRPSTAAAHADRPPAPHDFWTSWSLDPLVLVPLLAVAAAYAVGLHRLWRRAGAGRGVPGWRAGAFAGGILALALALVWPLDALGEALFAIHMAQHLVLMLVAAPLLVLGAPLAPVLHAAPAAWRRRLAAPVRWGERWRPVGRWLRNVMTATVLQLVALWAWHMPAAIAVSLRDDGVHALMHASLLGAALLFWWAVTRSGRAVGYGWGILALLISAKLSGLLGAVIAFASRPLYPAYGDRAAAWGLTPLEDQQLAGTVMLALGGAAYVLTAVALVAAWFATLERRAPTVVAGPGR